MAVLCVLCGAVELDRAIGLARRGAAETRAHLESRWRPWAYRRSDLPLLGRAAAEIRSGALVALLVPKGLTHDWWLVMAIYYFPRQRVVGVYDLSERELVPAGAVRVVLDRHGRFRVVPPRDGK
jgi:hypothetical protein